MLAIFSFSECLGLGASILKWHVCSSSRLGNCKNAKNTVFLTRNPYRLWSFQLGAQNMSKIESFSENTVFCVTKLNHACFVIFPGARMLIWLLSWSLTVICTKVWELWTGNLCVNKKYEAPNSKCTASLVTKRYFAKNLVFYAIKLFWKSQHMASRRKLQWKWMSRGYLGAKAPMEMGIQRSPEAKTLEALH